MQEPTNSARKSPQPGEEAVDILEMASLLLTHWWKIAVCALLGALLMLGYSSNRYVPTYTATAKLYINNTNISIGIAHVSVNSADLSASQTLVGIYREFIDSHLVLDATGSSLADQGYPGYTYENLKSRIITRAAGETQMLYLSAVDPDPEAAIAIINTLVKTLPPLAENIIEGSSVIAIDPAYSATLNPSDVRKSTVMGGAAGFAIAAVLVLLYYYFLNDLLERQDWMTTTFSAVPQLGCVPDTVRGDKSGYYSYYTREKSRKRKRTGKRNAETGENLSFYGTEAYNAIRTNIKFCFHNSDSGRVLGFTSPMAGDGKTYTAVNLAYSMAKDNSTVLLIDGDLRKATMSQYFKRPGKVGLSEVLSGQVSPEEAICEGRMHEKLSVMFAGSIPPNPSELLGAESMGKLLQTLREQYDYILLDLPPVGSVIDAAAVAGFLDGMVLIVRHDHSHKKHVRAAVRQLELTGVRLLGYVYNANIERYSLYGRKYSRYYQTYYKGKQP